MNHSERILVALGRHEDQRLEFEWVAGEARARRVGVDLLRFYEFGNSLLPWHDSTDRMIIGDLRVRAERRVASAVEEFRALAPDVDVTGSVHYGIVWQSITESADRHAITVLGTRRLGPLGAAALGSVSTLVAARARRPVVVVNGPAGMPEEDPAVVVGLAGGAVDDDVLGFAFDHADRRGRPVDAVFCWPPDVLASMQWRPEQPPPEQATRWLAEAVAGWQEKFPAVTVRRSVLRARPVEGLVARSLAQDLLVIGARARHPRLEAPLGSVSQGVLHHATCPVAVIH